MTSVSTPAPVSADISSAQDAPQNVTPTPPDALKLNDTAGGGGEGAGSDNPTAAGFDTGPSFSEARKAFLNRAANQAASPTSPNNPPGKSSTMPINISLRGIVLVVCIYCMMATSRQ